MHRIPFHYSCADIDILKERGYTTLYIQIYCNNQKSTLFKFRVDVTKFDLGSYEYNERTEETEIRVLLRDFIKVHWQADNDIDVSEYNYHRLVNPYLGEKIGDAKLCKKFYGEKKQNIEAIIQTEIMKLYITKE